MSTARKIDIAEKAKTELLTSNLMIFFKYHGLTVKKLEELRKLVRKVNGQSGVCIIKNTLFKLIMGDVLKAELSSKCKGPIAIIYAKNDPIILSKIVKDFFISIKKQLPQVTIEYCIIDNQIHTQNLIETMCEYQSTDALKAEFLGLLTSPLSSFLSVLEAPAQQLIATLQAKEEKEVA